MWNSIVTDLKIWGTNPWEETAWEIGERFAVKWWFLISDDALIATNTWRSMRGETKLTAESIKSRFDNSGLKIM